MNYSVIGSWGTKVCFIVISTSFEEYLKGKHCTTDQDRAHDIQTGGYTEIALAHLPCSASSTCESFGCVLLSIFLIIDHLTWSISSFLLFRCCLLSIFLVVDELTCLISLSWLFNTSTILHLHALFSLNLYLWWRW